MAALDFPGSPTVGQVYSANGVTYTWDGVAWSAAIAVPDGGGAVAGGAIYENKTNITSNYVISTGKNAMSVGPITIASGVTVTVPSGQRWVIL